MTADISRSLVIESSPRKLLLLAGLGLCLALPMTVGAIWGASLPDVPFYKKLLGCYIGTVFLGACTAVHLWRLLRWRGPFPVVTISPEGIRDTRVAAAIIPWRAITGISTISTWGGFRRHKFMVLALRLGVIDQLGPRRFARWNNAFVFGADRLGISAGVLTIDYDTLLRTTLDYYAALTAPPAPR